MDDFCDYLTDCHFIPKINCIISYHLGILAANLSELNGEIIIFISPTKVFTVNLF